MNRISVPLNFKECNSDWICHTQCMKCAFLWSPSYSGHTFEEKFKTMSAKQIDFSG